MKKLYSYVLRYDDGGAPNPFWGTCTLTICKPDIRRTAQVGDWVIGTGSKNSRLKDGKIYNLADSLVYAMKVSKKLPLADYDSFCRQHLQNKISKWFNKDYRLRVGDCIYDYSVDSPPIQRKGVHSEKNIKRDLGGQFSLMSKHFYYFGEEPRPIPTDLKHLIKQGQKHKVVTDSVSVDKFEKWIKQFEKNKIYANPQLRFEFDRTPSDKQIARCATRHLEDC